MESVALTDHGTMSGVVEFYKEAQAAQVKPIIGMEAYVAPRKYTDKDPAFDRQYYHLTLLAMNQAGYRNLLKLSTAANLEGFYYRPRIDRELLAKHSEGIIVLSGCIGSEVSDALRNRQYKQAKETVKWYKDIFGDRYYLELHDHGHPKHPTTWDEQNLVNEDLLKLASELKLPSVVTSDAHYLRAEDKEAHEILLCVQTGAFLNDQQRFSLKDFELHLADPADIIERWGETHPELIANTKKIAQRCHVELELDKILIPKFPTPKSETEKTLLQKKVWQGLAWRYGGVGRDKISQLSVTGAKKKLETKVIERAEYELGVVNKMALNGYFLIVSDFINWGKDQGIVFGPGRGSSASSIMAYAMRITDIDPLEYDLLFERYLNVDRISMPDMDIDIQDSRRDEVIQYCIKKYGRDRVANIVTFGRMAARNSVRDVARVLQVAYAEADRLAKMIPPPIQGRHIPLASSLKTNLALKAEYDTNETSKRVFDLAMRLEGTIRSHGVHAAGVVIAPDDIVNFVPLEMAQKGVLATQYSMGPIEDLGLLKIDFLGLSNLTIIKNTLRIVKKVMNLDIDITQVPLDDKKTYKLLQRGETTGVFQLESPGMRRYLKQLKPTIFDDIIAMVALYRPGPMQWIDDFIARKHGLRKIEYLHPVMKETLESTYGVIVYQEQVMQLSKDMCGFSGGQADSLRKAIGKKNPKELAKLKKDFINGAIKTVGAQRKLMDRFWRQLEEFAAYCFNKVHSACYAQIAYQTAYLKANFPTAFMAALMTSDYDNTDRLAIEITECKHMGITVLPPDVNQSFHEFAVVPEANEIRFGLDAIKNVGQGAAEEILRARDSLGGQFNSLEDFCRQVNCHIVNRKVLESLIKAGAMDRFAERSLLLHNVDNILALSNRLQRDALSGQVDLFGDSLATLDISINLQWTDDLPKHPPSILLAWERDLLGLYLTAHPLEMYESLLNKQTTAISKLKTAMDGQTVTVGGSVAGAREIITKNGAKMAFVRLADMSGELELVVFPKTYQQTAGIWQRDQVVMAKGKISSRSSLSEGDVKILVDEAWAVTSDQLKNEQRLELDPPSGKTNLDANPRLYIRLEDSMNHPLLLNLREKLDNHHGETEVVLITGDHDSKQVIKLPQTISINEESLRTLAALFGSTNVVVK